MPGAWTQRRSKICGRRGANLRGRHAKGGEAAENSPDRMPDERNASGGRSEDPNVSKAHKEEERMNIRKTRKFLSVFLSIAMLFSLCAVGASAEGTQTLTTVKLQKDGGTAASPISVEVNGTDNVNVTATAWDNAATPSRISSNITWSITHPESSNAETSHVAIDSSTGVITVGAKAVAGSYTITATPTASQSAVAGSAVTATLTVTRATAAAATVTIKDDQNGATKTVSVNGSKDANDRPSI